MSVRREIFRINFVTWLIVATLTLSLAGGHSFVRAQQTDFSVEQIPADLLEGAGAVVRYSNTRVEVENPRNMIRHVQIAVTVLNSRGDDEGVAYVFYDDSRKINSLQGSIYDASGKLMRKIREKDFIDQSAISDFSIFEDNRVKFYHPARLDYPYTIVYEYEIKHTNTSYFQDWFPVRSPLVSVQDAVYEVICRDGFQIRVREMNISPGQVLEGEKGAVIHRWELHGVAAFGDEPFAPPPRRFAPHVLVAPVNFEYEGEKGSFSNWEEYGSWAYEHLLAGRDELPEATVSKIKQLVSDAGSDREKAARIYRYMQNKNRYVSIQVGIGGLQPMLAEEVDRLSYGDCKGLVNYTQALLAVAGIPSIYTEVAAGEQQRSYLPEFASFGQGNHVILCVPLNGDTTWLECTSKETPFGFLGTFTSDRNVLMITPEGGKITRTPALEHTARRRQAVFTLDGKGTASADVETRFTGAFFSDRRELEHATPRRADELLKQLYPLSSLQVLDWEIDHPQKEAALTRERLRLQVRDFTSRSSGRLFLPLNPLNRAKQMPASREERKTDVFIPQDHLEADTFEFRLPEKYPAEFIPDELQLSKSFGEYSLTVSYEDGVLVCYRKLYLKKGSYPPGIYPELVEFFQDVQRSDYQKAVFTER